MEAVYYLMLLLTGLGVGTVSGLLGVGGCFIMTPVQYFILTADGVDPSLAIKVAFGTNLLVVFPTALSSSARHHREGSVMWRYAAVLGAVGVPSAAAGSYTAILMPGDVLKTIFSLAIVFGALRMATARPVRKEGEPCGTMWLYAVLGMLFGFVTGLIGIGGGVLMVPLMVILLNYSMREAVATSTAVMIFTSLGGAVSYIILGLGQPGLPEYSVGYVNLIQWALLAGTSTPMAQIGARMAHRIDQESLKWIFISVILYIGLKMSGVFSALGLPI